MKIKYNCRLRHLLINPIRSGLNVGYSGKLTQKHLNRSEKQTAATNNVWRE